MTRVLLQNTVVVGAGSTVGAMVLGLCVALALSASGQRGRNLLLGLALTTLALPPFVLANTWMHYLGDTGTWRSWLPLNLYSPAGVVLIFSLWLWPITALAAWAAWQRLEPAHLEVEPDLHGAALIRFLLLPMARGALVVAGMITFVLAANNLTVPALLQVNVYPARVWLSFSSTFWVDAAGHFDWAQATALSWPLVLLPAGVLLLVRRRAFPWPALRGGTPASGFRAAIGTPILVGVFGIALTTGVLSVGLPLWQIAGNAQTWAQLPNAITASRSAILNATGIATAVALTCLAVGVLSLLPKFRSTGASQRDAASRFGTLLWLPFLVPGVLIGIALIQVLNRPATAWVYQSIGIVVLALMIRYLAVGWSLARHAVRATDPDLTDAARIEGASLWQLFRHVLWPQVAPQLAAAWCVVFLLCLWDVETLVLIVPPGGETLALRVFNLLHYGHTAHVNALCLILLALAVGPLIVAAAFVKLRTTIAGGGRAVHALTSVVMMAAVGVASLLLAGCAPRLARDETRIDSQLFDRVKIIATRGVGPGEVNKPRSVAVGPDDCLYVLDFTGRVQKFSPDGKFLLFWQLPEIERGKPKGISVDPRGNIVVVEPHYARINLFSPDGRLLAQWGDFGTDEGQLAFPRAAVINTNFELFVCEFQRTERVQQFALSGQPPGNVEATFVRSFGSLGSEPGQFNRAEGLALDREGHLIVADACNHRIQVFAPDGTFLRAYGAAGNGVGELSYPYDVCVDREGRHYVCEFGNSRIQVFDAEGRSLEIIGGPGSTPGRFNNPWGVALDSRGNLYVADSQNHRVQKLVRKADGRGQNAEVQSAPGGSLGGDHVMDKDASSWLSMNRLGALTSGRLWGHRVPAAVKNQEGVRARVSKAGCKPALPPFMAPMRVQFWRWQVSITHLFGVPALAGLPLHSSGRNRLKPELRTVASPTGSWLQHASILWKFFLSITHLFGVPALAGLPLHSSGQNRLKPQLRTVATLRGSWPQHASILWRFSPPMTLTSGWKDMDRGGGARQGRRFERTLIMSLPVSSAKVPPSLRPAGAVQVADMRSTVRTLPFRTRHSTLSLR